MIHTCLNNIADATVMFIGEVTEPPSHKAANASAEKQQLARCNPQQAMHHDECSLLYCNNAAEGCSNLIYP
jgi:hypothetical protein